MCSLSAVLFLEAREGLRAVGQGHRDRREGAAPARYRLASADRGAGIDRSGEDPQDASGSGLAMTESVVFVSHEELERAVVVVIERTLGGGRPDLQIVLRTDPEEHLSLHLEDEGGLLLTHSSPGKPPSVWDQDRVTGARALGYRDPEKHGTYYQHHRIYPEGSPSGWPIVGKLIDLAAVRATKPKYERATHRDHGTRAAVHARRQAHDARACGGIRRAAHRDRVRRSLPSAPGHRCAGPDGVRTPDIPPSRCSALHHRAAACVRASRFQNKVQVRATRCSIASILKTAEVARLPWVRIPPPPQSKTDGRR
jgi:hypothetical protein